VHLVEQELLEHLGTLGFALKPGQLGENITTLHIKDCRRLSPQRDGRRFMLGSVMGVVLASGEVSNGDAIHQAVTRRSMSGPSARVVR